MAATHSSNLDADSDQLLLDIAASAIECRLDGSAREAPPDLAALPTSLTRTASCFVSLQTRAGLRGCCGRLEAFRPLAEDAWHNAQASAFADPRFPPLQAREWPLVSQIEVSVLSALEPVAVTSEAQLLDKLVPGVDGLVLACGGRRATFLPRVWDQVADSREFLRRLKMKAGWPPDYWARDMAVQRYSTTEVSMEWPQSRLRVNRPAGQAHP